MIKRQTATFDMPKRQKTYDYVVKLLKEENSQFIFYKQEDFNFLREIDQVSLIVEDLLTSICIQCTDLFCHLLLLYAKYPQAFFKNLDNCINETLRLYPLTDIWTRQAEDEEKGWIASLVQLNRNGWQDPDEFKPDRWHKDNQQELISWGFDARGCPATKIGYNLTKHLFSQMMQESDLWIIPANNFEHERTFPDGCQLWIGKGKAPTTTWQYKGKFKSLVKQWCFSRFRVIEQRELW